MIQFPQNSNKKTTYIFDANTKNKVSEFKSLKDACLHINVPYHKAVSNMKNKTPLKGFYLSYTKELFLNSFL